MIVTRNIENCSMRNLYFAALIAHEGFIMNFITNNLWKYQLYLISICTLYRAIEAKIIIFMAIR